MESGKSTYMTERLKQTFYRGNVCRHSIP